MSKVILDTSVWIEYFKGNPDYCDSCQELIDKGEVSTIEIIFAELLQGGCGSWEMKILKAYYELIPKVELDKLYLKAGEYSQKEKLFSKGLGFIDACIIWATLDSGFKLWTLDKKIRNYLTDHYLYV